VCPKTSFYNDYIKGKYITEKRKVNWLLGKPVWDYLGDEQKLKRIKDYASSLNLQIFDSDTEVIKSFVEDRK
jgi:hypothetical protein